MTYLGNFHKKNIINYYLLILFVDSIQHHYPNIYYLIKKCIYINSFGIETWLYKFFSKNTNVELFE